jgi:thiamine-phosphate pyrophosphorylase
MFGAGLYPVITEKFCAGRSSLEVLQAVVAAGVEVVQLREKELAKEDLLVLAKKYREITKIHNVSLIINDHVDIALAVGAEGVHLGQEDASCEKVKGINPDLIVGVSTHDLEEAVVAEKAGADYINIGPIFNTKTKELKMQALGVAALKEIRSKISIPFTVMGGIKEKHIPELLKAGAKRIAMVTEITQAGDIEGTIRRLQSLIVEKK